MAKLTRQAATQVRFGIDTGGTFTDFLAIWGNKIATLKVPSTPHNPAIAILSGINQLLKELAFVPQFLDIAHGTTVATNALLERKGAKTALITTAGFEDVLEIGRQARPEIYNLAAQRPDPLVPRALRFGIHERVAADGSIIHPLHLSHLSRLKRKLKKEKVESIAISLLFSFANPDHEKAIAAALRDLALPLSISHEIHPEYREFERTSTVVMNAYLIPKVAHYIHTLTRELNQQKTKSATSKPAYQLRIMQSSGGSISAQTAAQEPVRTILSGPAGGVVAATKIAAMAGCTDLITFDMGGTSTDVALCRGGAVTTNEAKVTDLPVAVPVLDIHTVGAGGGSIASVDQGGALRVGPESAGADPGPACYGKGDLATVTDANAVLGRFGGGELLGGKMQLDLARAAKAVDQVAQEMNRFSRKKVTREEAAHGIIRVANANMERALRLVSVERGQDPRRFTLLSFGGAGGLHCIALAAALRIPHVMIPAHPGAFSALGVLLADVVKDYSQTVMLQVQDAAALKRTEVQLKRTFHSLQRTAREQLRLEKFSAAQIRLECSLAIRYQGQSFDLTTPFLATLGDSIALFHRLHRERYGYANEAQAVEIVSLKVRGIGVTTKPELPQHGRKRAVPKPLQFAKVSLSAKREMVPVYARETLHCGARLKGPALILEYGSTTLVPTNWELEVDKWGNLHLRPEN